MKILISGAQWHDNMTSIMEDGFKEAGNEVQVFVDNPKHYSEFLSRVFNKLNLGKSSSGWSEKYRDFLVQELFKKIQELKPDLVFVYAGLKFPGEAIKAIREKTNIPIACFVVDDPGFNNAKMLHDLSFYSHLFVIDKSWIPILKIANPCVVSYLPHVGNDKVFKPLNLKKKYDVCFAGNVGLGLPSGPAGYFRASLLNLLAREGYKIKAFLPGFTDETLKYFPNIKKIDYETDYKSHTEVNKLYNESRIALSIFGPHIKDCISPRVFDAALSGCFQIVEYKGGIDELFPNIPVFKSKDELLKLVDFYLKNDKEREGISREVRREALKNHIFKERAKTICRITSTK